MSEQEVTSSSLQSLRPDDRYEILSVLGRGATATVYLAHDRTLGRDIALKVFHAGESPGATERVRSEAIIGQALQHPHIVRVHGFTVLDGDAHALIMELVTGTSCRARLSDGWYSTHENVIATVRAVAAALSYAHARGVIHRDVKPSNILVANDGAVKLADFGIARCKWIETGFTGSGLAGTSHYMAPELLTGERPTELSDMYSLGVIARELWEATDRSKASAKQSRWFEHFIDRCTSPQPSDRLTAAAASEYLSTEHSPIRGLVSGGKLVRALPLGATVLFSLMLAAAALTEFNQRVLLLTAQAIMWMENASGVSVLPLVHRLKLKVGTPEKLLNAIVDDGNQQLFDALAARSLLPSPNTAAAGDLLCHSIIYAPPMVARLLDWGVSPKTNCRNDPDIEDVVGVAIDESDEATRKVLIERGVLQLSTDEQVMHALRRAFSALEGRDLIRVIKALGADRIRPQEQVAVIKSAAQWPTRNLRALTAAGVDLNVAAEHANTALHLLSAECDRRAVWRVLRIREVRTDLKNEWGMTAQDVACYSAPGPRAEAIRADLLAHSRRR